MRHSAHALAVHLDDGFFYLLGTLVEDGARALKERLALRLPRAHGGAATGAVDEAARLDHLVHNLARTHVALQEVFHVIHVVQEVLLHEDVGLAVHLGLLLRVYHRGIIDIEVQVRLAAHLHREALLAVVFRGLRVLGGHAVGCHGRQAEGPAQAHEFDFIHGERIGVIFRDGFHRRASRLHLAGGVQKPCQILAHGVAQQRAYRGEGGLRALLVAVGIRVGRVGVGEVVVREVGGQPVVRRGVGVFGGEVLAVAQGGSAVYVEVLHPVSVGHAELLFLVAGYHVDPFAYGVADGVDGVRLRGAVVAVGQHDDVVHL